MLEKFIENMDLDKDILLDFFLSFSRFEFALKRSGYVFGRDNAQPDYKKFYEKNEALFHKLLDDVYVAESVEFLYSETPMVQCVNDHRLDWRDYGRVNSENRCLEDLVNIVKVARNNLFHGGKYLSGPKENFYRNHDLLNHSLVVLKACLELDANLKDAFYEGICEYV